MKTRQTPTTTNPRRRLFLALSVIVLTLTALLLAARVLAPTARPQPAPAADGLTVNLLSGTITGLDPGDGVRLQLEQLVEAGVNGGGEILDRFDLVNGPWQQQGLALISGHYTVVPEGTPGHTPLSESMPPDPLAPSSGMC